MNWRPTASLSALQRRAAMLTAAREFFSRRGVLEVETPILSAAGASDPQIESLTTHVTGAGAGGGAGADADGGGGAGGGGAGAGGGRFYLHTSPEYSMKRLLASGSGDIYQICKVFRDGERGRWHNPEFTLLEWYRLGYDDVQLMTEVEMLIGDVLAPFRPLGRAQRLSYAAALQLYAGVDAHTARDAELTAAAERHGVDCRTDLDRDAKLDLLMGLVVGPLLGFDRPCFICDYPASQASLARLKPGPPPVAARFELYIDGVELANGFHELVDGVSQRARFGQDLAVRRARGQVTPPLDERLLEAMKAGLPDCAGVALGFDRLVAVASGAPQLADVMAFTIENA